MTDSAAEEHARRAAAVERHARALAASARSREEWKRKSAEEYARAVEASTKSMEERTHKSLAGYTRNVSEVFYGREHEQAYLRAAVKYQRCWDEMARARPWYMPLWYWRFVHLPTRVRELPPVLVRSRDPLLVWKQRHWNPDRIFAATATGLKGSRAMYRVPNSDFIALGEYRFFR